jgi:hypothetical protein
MKKKKFSEESALKIYRQANQKILRYGRKQGKRRWRKD